MNATTRIAAAETTPLPDVLTSPNGFAVPTSRIRDDILFRHQTATALVEAAQALHDELRARKEQFFADVDAFIDLTLERYNARLGGKRGGLVIANFGETVKVEVSTADYLRVNEAIVAAQALMNEVLDDVGEGANDDVRTLLANAFVRDEKTGRLNIQRLQETRRVKLSHPKWPDVQAAIADSLEWAGSRRYIRFHVRKDGNARWEQINLNFSSL
ncbi:hypothetical protein CFR78_04340 [Komagataeibacter rhaeticus]|uniref:DUF3164 family protein n=1 Tax=Komagataeibacter rhaeticus TaxID=215221 RepID=UPI0004D5F6AC|nr:DUF3164 family protein [Komagataeibacter rhaeticus]KDU96477.1 hypothetical protein GLUCORHAEAF1_01815 [Komagataeibacter rhaeticus AF1]PYD54204.1 hypothetical protein CFR78_04340 [Komagataeibacter rhaeticus]GBQ15181.1 hypothetical protein AA16663_2012 [Komagataeibacter rhaeticus DSM 16663]